MNDSAAFPALLTVTLTFVVTPGGTVYGYVSPLSTLYSPASTRIALRTVSVLASSIARLSVLTGTVTPSAESSPLIAT